MRGSLLVNNKESERLTFEEVCKEPKNICEGVYLKNKLITLRC